MAGGADPACLAASPLPEISVVVPAHNAAATLGACLAALAASRGCRFEVIVADDASTDATAAIAAAAGARVVRLPRQQGAAAARNAGARAARASLLFFTDADVLVQPDTLAQAVAYLAARPGVSAVFGSYTADTVHGNLCSVYKNLAHHLTHQAARVEASTFWSGAGAVRAAAFWAVGGFDPADTRGADVEDIALGYRLREAGCRIHLDRTLQVTHAKHYSLAGLIRSDVCHRAIPWTRLMLRARRFQNDLNTGGGSLLSAAALLAFAPALVGAAVWPPLAALAVVLAGAFLLLNRRLLGHCAARGPRFLAGAVALTALYYLYAVVGASLGLALYLREQARRPPRPTLEPVAPPEVLGG